ncbi:MAG TPA: acyl-CoA dehydrogenase [Actinomycetota bacterium]|nr:acyl-CoA dehydrogenase [Actinomycetota bacterium]
MDLRDTPAEAEFRQELRSWLARNLPPAWGTPDWVDPPDRVGFLKDWSRKLSDAGYVGITWPEEYGGRGLSITFQAIAYEELARADVPEHIGLIGIGMAGPTIMARGSEEQKRKYLRPILTGEEVWCQGFSEPGSGSDLASLQTRAERDGDGWLITGQKVWSSFAHVADRCILLARTDPQAPRHKGITYFLVDMHAPGVEVRPLRQITGDAEFNEIFLDGVRVADEDRVGDVNDGWSVAITTLLHERAGAGFILAGLLETRFRQVVDLARRTPADGGTAIQDPVIRDRLARLFAGVQALRFTNHRALSAMRRTGVPGSEGSISKLHWSETNQRLTSLALDVLGPEAALGPGGRATWQYAQLRSLGNTIEAGTSEILRNIVAERVLGLPKSR